MRSILKQILTFATMKMVSVFITVAVVPLLNAGIGQAADKNSPRLHPGYVFTTHHTPLMVATERGEAFKTCSSLPTSISKAIRMRSQAARGY